MRQILAPVLTTILFFSPLVGAQQQEKKLLDRINRPNMELTNPMQGKAFSGGGGVQMRDAVVKSAVFDSSKSAYLKEFSGARSFLGIKNPWFGNRVFETKSSTLTRSALVDSTYPVRQAATGGFAGSGKRAETAPSSVQSRPFLLQGGAQGGLEQISDKISKEMTIDDIREMLNKPR
ncbi:MAG: hypothetical protein ACO3GO_00415 [Terrimicrobiaceae bacterium]